MDETDEIIIGKFRAIKTIYERDLSITEEGMETLCDTLRQSLYELLVDEMPKERAKKCTYGGVACDGEYVNWEETDPRAIAINQMRTECLAVIKRVLIGGE